MGSGDVQNGGRPRGRLASGSEAQGQEIVTFHSGLNRSKAFGNEEGGRLRLPDGGRGMPLRGNGGTT